VSSKNWYKFILDSKDPFSIKVAVSFGKVNFGVGFDLTTVNQNPIWTIKDASPGTYQI